MSAKSTGDVVDAGHILATEQAANGVIIAQVGDVVSGDVREPQVEIWGPIGYAAMPSKADDGTAAAEAIALTGTDRNRAIAYREMRCSEIYGNLGPGEVCIFAAGEDAKGQAKVCLKADGSIFIATTADNTHDALGCYVKVGPTEFRIQYPFGAVVFDATGFHIVHQSGAKFSLGGIANPVQPNYIRMDACAVAVDSPQINLGPTATNGGKGVFLAPVVAPVASVQAGVPTPIGAGMGVIVGVTSTSVFLGV
jgi:hypothetical protein